MLYPFSDYVHAQSVPVGTGRCLMRTGQIFREIDMATQKMTHPEASGRGKTIEVDPQLVEHYASQGWQKVSDSKSSTTSSKTDSK